KISWCKNISGCFFHLCQNVFRCVQRSGLTQLYGDDPDFSQQIRALPALSFLPAADVIPTFEELKHQFPGQGQPVIDYFEHTYIGMKDRLSRPRKTPKFALELRNTNKNTLNGHHRTNNVVEGWNNRLSSMLNCSHPNLWKFIKYLKIEQSYIDEIIAQAEAGERQPIKKSQFRREKRLINILNKRTTTNLDKILTIAHNITLKSA
ncbi:unnamed protein product, partial [Didymodactylos carnosus]